MTDVTWFPRYPTEEDLWTPGYRYLGCDRAWCCGNVRQDLIADWVLQGIPTRWHSQIVWWHHAGLTPQEITPYIPTDGSTHDHLMGDIKTFILEGLTAPMVNTYGSGGILSGHEMLHLHRIGCPPEAIAAYLMPRLTEDNATSLGSHFVSRFTAWVDHCNGSPAFPLALMARSLNRDTINTLTALWGPTPWSTALPAQQVLALHDAGITPTELDTNPDLADADEGTLAAVAALRDTITEADVS